MLCFSIEFMSWTLGSGTLKVRMEDYCEPLILRDCSDLTCFWLFYSYDVASREAELLLSP